MTNGASVPTSARNGLISNASELQAFWDQEYKSATTPFDIDAPDDWIAILEGTGKIKGSVLDSGCGPGRTSLYLADRGYRVLGVDISINAIRRAKKNAAKTGSKAVFQQANMCEFTSFDRMFDTVVDIGCFHSLYQEDRASYAANLFRICCPGAVIYLRAISEHNRTKGEHPTGKATPALSEEQIRTAFLSCGWTVRDLTERQIKLFLSEERTPEVYCWFAEIQHP
jgi:SAM-dependent methyltransferase